MGLRAPVFVAFLDFFEKVVVDEETFLIERAMLRELSDYFLLRGGRPL